MTESELRAELDGQQDALDNLEKRCIDRRLRISEILGELEQLNLNKGTTTNE